jgi:FtsP/CotA-like multicopper oxidase with cupredoxin domain
LGEVIAVVLAAAIWHPHGPSAATSETPVSVAQTPPPTASDPHAGHAMPAGGHAGHGAMAPVDVTGAPSALPNDRGGWLLEPRLVGGVKEFPITVGVVEWWITEDVKIGAYSYNRQVPGPTIRVRPGDLIRVNVTNRLPEPTTIHWHGLDIPIEQDGVPGISQEPILPGQSFNYQFAVPNTPGTFFYHSHFAPDRQQTLGLYGAFIIDDGKNAVAFAQEHTLMLGEWRVDDDGTTRPAMDDDGMKPNYFTINGKSFPATETISAKVGDKILLRLIGSGQGIHPIHIHGGPFQIVATDGYPVPSGLRLTKDTVLVGPGERYDVLWTALRPGRWMLHCHINHHTTNNHKEDRHGGGMMMIIDVKA